MSPVGATVNYKWMQSTSDSGYEAIGGGTGKTVTLTKAQVGKTIVCECTANGQYSGKQRSQPTAAVKAKSMPMTAAAAAVKGSEGLSRRGKNAGAG